MLIICPDCEASYEVEPAELGAGGRKVRCTECSAVWHARAPDESEIEPEFDAEDEPVLIEASDEDVAFREHVRTEPAPRRFGFARRGAAVRTPRRKLLPLALAAGCAALVMLGVGRQTVVELVPDLAGLYAFLGVPVNVRGLEFRDVATVEAVADGVPQLAVRGSIVNVTGETVHVPRLRLAVRSVSGREIFVWTAMPAKGELAAGETLPFMAQLASPPAEGRDVAVRFVNTRDVAQNLAAK